MVVVVAADAPELEDEMRLELELALAELLALALLLGTMVVDALLLDVELEAVVELATGAADELDAAAAPFMVPKPTLSLS